MGPRKRLASRGKRTAEPPVTGERRTKHRLDPVQPVPPPVSPPQAISSMGNRAVASGRRIDMNFLDQENFRIGQWIRQQHWERISTLNVPYYPFLVRNFFENLRIGHASIESTVKGVLIVLNEDRLSRVLAVPKDGMCFMTLDKKEEALKVILNKEKITDFGSLLAGQLSLEMRLLHNITSRVFLPKTGRFDWVSEREIVFMYYLMKGEQINLPYLILTQIKEAAKGSRACLPYGMIFTLIFNEFGVSLEGETSKKLLHTDHYTEKSLHRMGYIKKNNVWVKKQSSQREVESDSEDEEEEDENEEEEEEEENEVNAPAETAVPETTADDQATSSVPTMEATRSSPPAPATQQPATFSSDQLAQLSELLKSEMRSLVGEIKKEISQSHQQVTQSYEELKEEIRDLTLRVEVLEQHQRSQDPLHDQIMELRSDFGRMRSAADRFGDHQDQILSSMQQGLKKIKVGVESTLICLLGSSYSSHGGAGTSSRPPPQPSPRPPPHAIPRPPFSSTIRSGTGFPEPSSRAGVDPRTHRSRRQASSRSSKIHAPYSVPIDDSSESSD